MYFVGQRWFSEAEPELGLGIIEANENKQIKVYFKASDESRTYGFKTAPLKRLLFDIDEVITTEDGSEFKVEEFIEQNNIRFYKSGDSIIPEMDLKSALTFSHPQDKLFAGTFDDNNLFKMRYDSFLKKRAYQEFKHKGLLGSRIRLIPHQVYITKTISDRLDPKVMLADEVGLGKTIEAGLILNSLLEKNKAHRALVIVPDSLVYQWFFELKNKFGIQAKTMSVNDELEIEAESLEEGSHYIISLKRLMMDSNLKEDIVNTSDWDVLIVDEAHNLKWMPDQPSEEYNLIQKLSESIKSIILLSATPEILGVEGHFSRLKLLDNEKFSSLENYIKTGQEYQNHLPIISKIIEGDYSKEDILPYIDQSQINQEIDHKTIINQLIDTHGTGRVYMRNTREYLEKFNLFFPKRVLHKMPLKLDGQINDKLVFSKKLTHLKNILEKYENEKVLLLVQSKMIATKIQRQLELLTSIPVGVFHSGQSLMERDRQAAYFAQEDGARLLICTEIGSEGRNFEFAHHLFLFDLPKLPEQLEQRIGRLDRIGQKKDINVHVPFIENTFEEILFRWYDEVIESFKKAPKGATVFYSDHRDELINLLEQPFSKEKLSEFIESKKEAYRVVKEALNKGHDALLDLNSFNKDIALSTIKNVNEFNEKYPILPYLNQAADACGLHLEELSAGVHYIKPNDNMFIPAYPALDNDGFSFTDDRDLALVRDDLRYLSWEHPLIKGTIELFTQSEIGNMAIVTHDKKLGNNVFFEFIFKLEGIGSESSDVNRFLPVTPIRVLLNSSGEDFTQKYPKSKIEPHLQDNVSIEQKSQISKIPKDSFSSLYKKAESIAEKRSHKYINMGIESSELFYKQEIDRLRILSKKNSLVSDELIQKWLDIAQDTKNAVKESKASVDSIRIII